MRETWLRPNRRALCFGFVPPLALAALGGWLFSRSHGESVGVARWIGAGLVVVALAITLMLLGQLLRPRIAYRNGELLFYLRSGRPIAVPVAVVEAFFVGRGPTTLPGRWNQHQTMNLVARLSQRETEWAHRHVSRSLGSWCDGYVTIRGTWCEPLEPELIRRFNRRLKEAKSELANDC